MKFLSKFFLGRSLRSGVSLIIIFCLWMIPVTVLGQNRRGSLNKTRQEKKTAKPQAKPLSKEAYKNMPASMRMSPDQGPDEYVQGIIWQGGPGVSKTVEQIMSEEAIYQASLSRTGKRLDRERGERGNELNEFRLKKSQKNSPAPLEYDSYGGWVNPSERQTDQPDSKKVIRPYNPQAVSLTFSGPDASVGGGFVPPDTQGDVGPTEVLMTANDRITSYTRAGVVGAINSSTTTFWASVLPGVANSPCDNHVRYDRLSQRWFVVAIGCGTATPNKIAIAVSNTPTLTGSSVFTFFAFTHDAVGTTPNTDTGGFADYPTLGVDKNALYVGDNVFNAAGTALLGCSAFIINKANLLAGALTVTAFRNIGTSSTNIYTPQGVDSEDPSATTGYFVGSDVGVYNVLNVRKVTTPGGVPAMSGSTAITVSTGPGKNVPATNGSLDPLDDRPFAAMINVNRVLTSARQDVASLWTAQSFSMANTSPFGPSTAASARMGGRWYEINTDPVTPALRQSGTFIDTTGTTAATAIHSWVASNAMSGQGFMAIGSSIGGTPVTPGPGTIVAGRLREDSPTVADALGVTQSTTIAFAGLAAYVNESGGTGRRWGDYSQTIVDPNDDQTMWTFQEYSDSLGNWHERAIKLAAPAPCMPNSCAATVTLDASGTFHGVATFAATSTAGSECYDGNVIDWSGFRNYSNYADNTGTAVSYTHGGGPGFHGPGGINAAGNGHLMTASGAASAGTGTASIATFAPNAPGNSTIYLSPTSFKAKVDITGATGGTSKFPLTVTNPDGQTVTRSDAICTLATTAANASISGRVTSAEGRGIRGAFIRIQSADGTVNRVVMTNSMGYYMIPDMETGITYVISIQSRRFVFEPASVVYTHQDQIADLNFTAQ